MLKNLDKIVLGLFVSVLVLLPFSRYSELPILFLSLIGIVGLIKDRKPLIDNPQFKILSLVFSCYFLMMLLSSFDSYWQNKTLLVAFASIRFYLASVALLLYLKAKHINRLIQAVALVAVFWSLDAIFQYFVGVDLIGRASYEGRLNGIFGEHHVKLGPVLALLLPITMIALRKQHSLLRWLSTLIIIITIILSGTRSAWVMMVFTLLAYWFHHVKKRRFQLLLKAGFVATIMVGSLWFVSPEFQQRVNRTLSAFDGTSAGLNHALAERISIWKTSWRMIEGHPVNGVGAHAFRKAYPEFASKDYVLNQNGGVGNHAHHWVLEILTDTGVIGLMLFSFALFKLFWFVRKNYHPQYSWAFMIALFSAFLPLTSTYSIFASFWSICIWFIGIGLILVSKQND